MARGHQEARPAGVGPGSGTRLLVRGRTGLLIALPALRERKHLYCGPAGIRQERRPPWGGAVTVADRQHERGERVGVGRVEQPHSAEFGGVPLPRRGLPLGEPFRRVGLASRGIGPGAGAACRAKLAAAVVA